MTRKTVNENLVRVKTALAEKYERMAQTRNSKPRRENLTRVARRHREQAANLAKGGAA